MPSVSQVEYISNHAPIHCGSVNGVSCRGSQPSSWKDSAVPPIITTSTTPTSTPVRTSIRLYGSLWCSQNTNTPTTAVAARPIATPSSTALVPALSWRFWRKSTTSKPSR